MHLSPLLLPQPAPATSSYLLMLGSRGKERINSLPGEASLPRPSLCMVREVLCIHATQQPPCQNQVYIYPGLTWDFLALSCSFLQRNHKYGEGGFSIRPTYEIAGTSPAASNCKQPSSCHLSETMQQEVCKR